MLLTNIIFKTCQKKANQRSLAKTLTSVIMYAKHKLHLPYGLKIFEYFTQKYPLCRPGNQENSAISTKFI